MKWNTVIIVLLEVSQFVALRPNDKTPYTQASVLKKRYAVPDRLCISEKEYSGFTLKTPECLKHTSGFDTKIILCAHGDINHIAGYRADYIIKILYDLGIREVGLISVKSCNVGSGSFLDEMKQHMNQRGMKVGWLVGYKNTCALVSHTQHISSGFNDYMMQTMTAGMYKSADNQRVKIVEGNVKVDPPRRPSSRYR